MSLKFKFETDAPELAELIRTISEKALPAETAKALNRTVTFTAKEVAGSVSRETGIRKNLIKRRLKAIKRRRASYKKLSAWGFMGEVEFLVSKLTPKPKGKGGGVTYKTLPGQAPAPGAFFATMRSGKGSAFQRRGPARLPIDEERLNITKILRRHLGIAIRGESQKFLEKTVFENMEKRVKKDMIKIGLKNR